RIDAVDLEIARLDRDLPGNSRRHGGVIDEHAALAQGRENALRAEYDVSEIVVVADAGDYDIGTFGGIGRALGNPRRKTGIGGLPLVQPRRRTVEDGEGVAGVADVPGDSPAHDTQPQERDVAF